MSDQRPKAKPDRKPRKAPSADRAFIDAMERGEIHGDVVMLDDDGNPIPRLVYSAIPGVPPRLIPTP
jgi:hypothetical protein